MRAERIKDRDAAHAEVAVHFVSRRHRVDHGNRFGMTEPFVISEKESLVMNYWTTDGASKIVLHQKIKSHVVKRVSIEDVVPQELVAGPVELVGTSPGHNIDLAAAGATHLG